LDTQGETVARPTTSSWAVRLLPWWAALLAMAPFVSVLTGTSEFFHDDHFRFSTPMAGMVAEALRGGHLPLWNPWILTGTPLVAERGSMVAHPGMLLALVMEPSHAVGTLMVLLLGVLAAGSAALLRALAVRPVLATFSGAAIGLSGPALSYTSNAPFLATLAFLPLILLSALRIAEGRKAAIGGGLAGRAACRSAGTGRVFRQRRSLAGAVVALGRCLRHRAGGGRGQLVPGAVGVAVLRTWCWHRGQRSGPMVVPPRRAPGVHLAASTRVAAASVHLLGLPLARR
jgi:hypothetical protein